MIYSPLVEIPPIFGCIGAGNQIWNLRGGRTLIYSLLLMIPTLFRCTREGEIQMTRTKELTSTKEQNRPPCTMLFCENLVSVLVDNV